MYSKLKTINILKLPILLVILLCEFQVLQASYDGLEIDLTLKRSDPWKQSVLKCKNLDEQLHYTQNLSFSNSDCNSDSSAKVEKLCESNNISYNIDAYFHITKGSKHTENQEKKKKNSKDYIKPYQMSIDLSTPWSWLKNEDCQICQNGGECSTNFQKNYNYQFECGKNQIQCFEHEEECGIIGLSNEGLGVEGTFAKTYLRIDKNNRVSSYELILAKKISYENDVLADGVLGLGMEYVEELQEPGQESLHTNYRDSTGFVNNWFAEKLTKTQSFQLKLDDKPKLMIGDVKDDYIHQSDRYPMNYTAISANSALNGDEFQYYKWGVNIKKLEIMYLDPELLDQQKIVSAQNRHITQDFEDVKAQLSLSSSAIVMPKKYIDFFVEKLDAIYQISCSIDEQRQNFLVCRGLKEHLGLKDLLIFFNLEGEIKLHMNPKDLVYGCKKNPISQDYECILEIQQSFNTDVVILGDVVLKNSYIDFDMERRQIGFAHVKDSSYIKSVFSRLEGIFIEGVEDAVSELVFVMKFYFVIFFLILGFLATKHVNSIIRLVDSFLYSYFRIRIMQPNIETQRLTISEMEQSVQRTDDDDFISQRKYDAEIEEMENSGNLEDTNFDEI